MCMFNESSLPFLMLQFVTTVLVYDVNCKLLLLVKSMQNFKNCRSVASHCIVIFKQHFKLISIFEVNVRNFKMSQSISQTEVLRT